MNSVVNQYSVFLSYARQDEPWVAEFAKALRVAGIQDYRFDLETLSPSDDLDRKFRDALRQSDAFVVFLSTSSLENPNVLFEIGAALADDKTIIPVLIGNVNRKQIPFSLVTRQWLNTDSPTEAGIQVARIIEENGRARSQTE